MDRFWEKLKKKLPIIDLNISEYVDFDGKSFWRYEPETLMGNRFGGATRNFDGESFWRYDPENLMGNRFGGATPKL